MTVYNNKGGTGNSTKKKKLYKDQFEDQLLSSLIDIEKFGTTNLNEMPLKIEKSKDVVVIIKDNVDIIDSRKKNIIGIAYQQGKVFKIFKEQEKIHGNGEII